MSPFLVLVAIFAFFVYIYRFVTYKPAKNYPPGPIRIPIVGSYLHVLWEDFKYPHKAFEKMKKKYNSPIIGFYMGGFNTIVANDYESCKEIFTRPEFQGRVEAFPAQFRTFGKKLGLFSDDGPVWLHMKRFTLRELRDLGFGRRSDIYEGILEEETKDLIETIRTECETGKSILIPEIFFPPLFNCIFYILTGNRVPSKDRKKLQDFGSAALSFITNINVTGCMLAIIPWIRFLFPEGSSFKRLNESSMTLEKLMKESFKNHEESFDEEAVRDLIDVFIKNKKLYPHFTDEQLLITSIDFIFPNAAVGSVLAFTVIYLILYPNVQKKCQEEIDSTVGRGRLPTLNDRQNLPYIEATLREVMRRQTLNPIGLGHRATEDTIFFGYHVPKDTFLITNLWSMHMDEKVWGDPYNFRPERFLDDNGRLLKKDLSMPFGVGKRVCAGETFSRQNMFILMASLLQNFSWESDTPIDFSKNRSGVAVVPQPDLYVKFHIRN